MHQPAPPRLTIRPQSVAGLAFLALLGGNLCLAFGPWFVRLADTGPGAAGFWRLALAAPLVLVLPFAGGHRRPDRGKPLPWPLIGMIAFAGLFFAADLGVWHIGIHYTKLANATLFGNVPSLVFPIYGFLIARAWPSRGQAFALLLAALGGALLLGRSAELSRENLTGDLLCLVAGLLYTGYMIAIDRARGAIGPWPLLTLSTFAGLLPLLIFAWALGERILPTDWTPLIALALFSQVLGQGLLVYAIGHLSPVVIGLGLLTQPLVAALVGWFAYRERLGLADIVGAVAIAIALVLVRRPSPP